MLKPTLPPYNIRQWQTKPYPERLKMVCQAWAIQGYGSPSSVYLFYILKIAFYVWMWSFFCSFTPGLGKISSISSWWLTSIAFQKAVLWSMLFEGLGLGCGSGPLTGRYIPPFGGFLYFLRPHTTKMPLFPGLPLFGRNTRSFLDVAMYAAHLGFLLRALLSPTLSFESFLPTLILLPLLGLTDKTIFLSARAEHYLTALICFAFAGDWLAGSKLVWLGIWFWAATSKLNHHFPSVVCVMSSNSPFTNFGGLRKLLYNNYPEDLRPSKLATLLAHAGTLTEYTFPLLLLFGQGGTVTTVALVLMFSFHLFITSNVPMGVPIEWNIMMVYGGFFLFGSHSAVFAFSVGSPLLSGILLLALLGLPLLGNFIPSSFSFLTSMRYYAGNWAYSVWLFKKGKVDRLEANLVKTVPGVEIQLGLLYDEDTITAILSKVQAFRAMHLHGRALQTLLPKAVEDIDDYEYYDGEVLAGVVLGWNFGDGHLHNQQLLEAIQEQCHFREGDLRCIFVEAQPMLGSSMEWSIVDAATGVLEKGHIKVAPLRELQPAATAKR